VSPVLNLIIDTPAVLRSDTTQVAGLAPLPNIVLENSTVKPNTCKV
jgi:hypothetical protein